MSQLFESVMDLKSYVNHWTIGFAALGSFLFYSLRVPIYEDKIQLTYNTNSSVLSRVIKKSKLEQLTFRPCLAATYYPLQIGLMFVVELFYKMTKTQVKYHREIFKFKDGG